MIPIKLKMTNFMPYHQEEVDLSGISLACLCGENGAGKSALLAAMTWALWGKARDKVSDDELIASGEQEMSVDFEFMLGTAHYRALRKRSKVRNGESRLYFQVQDPASDIWQSLDEPNIRGTQRRIDEILRMDYETFINSAFLLQGRADEFARKAPGERKKVLAEILGLSYYDSLETKAKERRIAADNLIRDIDNRLRLLDHQLEELPTQQRIVAEASHTVCDYEEQAQKQEKVYYALNRSFTVLEAKHEEQQKLAQRINQAKGEREQAEVALKRAQADIADATATVAARPEVERGYADYQSAQAAVAVMTDRQSRYLQLTTHRNKLEMLIQTALSKLQHELHDAQARVREAESQASRVAEYEAQLAQQQVVLADFAEVAEQVESTRQQIQTFQNLITELETENKQLGKERDDMREKLKMLKGSDHQECPVCKSKLGADGYRSIEQHYLSEGTECKAKMDTNLRRMDEIRLMLGNEQAKLTNLERKLKGRGKAESDVAVTMNNLSRASKEAEQLADRRAREIELLRRMDSKAYAQAEQHELAALAEEVTQLAYDEAAFNALRRRERELTVFVQRRQELDKADTQLQLAQQAATHAQSTRNDKTALLETLEASKHELDEQLRGYADLSYQVYEAKARLDQIHRAQAEAKTQLDQATLRVSQLYDAQYEREAAHEDRNRVAEEKAIYDELALAFSRKGVQAMIIDGALPDIEREANELLYRMTDGKMRVKFKTQRSNRKGDSTIETLDMEISDGGSDRNYELYSGGEAFRINFAVRVAMSKLLAHRAGAQLQTLIIDEGFGALDGAGRERLIQAIRTVQDDFACILVITHIDELKDEFPYRLEVTKGLDGSHVELIAG